MQSFMNTLQAPQGSPFKITIAESIDRIKEEFSFLQAQYNRWDSSSKSPIFPKFKNMILTKQLEIRTNV